MSDEVKSSKKDSSSFSPKFFDAEGSFLGKLQKVLHIITAIIETLVAMVLIAGVVVAFLDVPSIFAGINGNGREGLRNLVSFMATIIIVVEFIHVIVSQNLGSVVEIIMLAITRELVIREYTTWELLAGVICIAGLFAVKKYLVTKKDR